jgi:DNA repair exonuclease SbcCD nuclease subunit
MKRKRRPIAIVFSDIHFNNWKAFNEDGKRINHSIRALDEIADKCVRLSKGSKPLPLWFAGDLMHHPFKVDNLLWNQVASALESRVFSRDIEMYAISGNHDQCERNTFTSASPTWLNGFHELKRGKFHLVDFRYADCGPYRIFGIPYLKNNKGFVEVLEKFKPWLSGRLTNILLIHTDIPGAEDCSNRVIEKVQGLPVNLKKALKPFRLVFNGHIHKPQVNIPDKLITVGSPIHQTKSDEGVEMGYWIVYDNLTYKFKPLRGYPKFITLPKGENAPDDKNFYLKKPAILKEEKKESLIKSQDRLKMGKKYCEIKKATKAQRKALIEILNQTYEVVNF